MDELIGEIIYNNRLYLTHHIQNITMTTCFNIKMTNKLFYMEFSVHEALKYYVNFVSKTHVGLDYPYCPYRGYTIDEHYCRFQRIMFFISHSA